MSTIELSTKKISDEVVIAYDPNSTKKSRKGGDVETQAGDTLGGSARTRDSRSSCVSTRSIPA